MAFREVTVLEVTEALRLWRSGVPKKSASPPASAWTSRRVRGYLKLLERCGLDSTVDLDTATATVVERLQGGPCPTAGRGVGAMRGRAGVHLKEAEGRRASDQGSEAAQAAAPSAGLPT